MRSAVATHSSQLTCFGVTFSPSIRLGAIILGKGNLVVQTLDSNRKPKLCYHWTVVESGINLAIEDWHAGSGPVLVKSVSMGPDDTLSPDDVLIALHKEVSRRAFCRRGMAISQRLCLTASLLSCLVAVTFAIKTSIHDRPPHWDSAFRTSSGTHLHPYSLSGNGLLPTVAERAHFRPGPPQVKGGMAGSLNDDSDEGAPAYSIRAATRNAMSSKTYTATPSPVGLDAKPDPRTPLTSQTAPRANGAVIAGNNGVATDRFGISNVPPKNAWGRTIIPQPSPPGGDLTSPEQLREFGFGH